MIVSKIQGGLGNQMFQFATAFTIDPTVYLDLEFINKKTESTQSFTQRNFALELFPNLRYRELSNFKRKIFLSNAAIYKYLRKLSQITTVTQKDNQIVQIPAANNIYLDGYFQSEQYFVSKRNEILQQFQFPKLDQQNQSLKEKILATPNSVAIHVRRGDYLKPTVAQYHGILPLSYYEQAISYLQHRLVGLDLVIFSDDPQFCRLHFEKYNNVYIVSGNEGASWKDMSLMSACQHHIIANSSFSWWGAWLSQYSNGIKIAPKNWFNNEVVDYNIDDIIPSSWIKI